VDHHAPSSAAAHRENRDPSALTLTDRFGALASQVSQWTGSPMAFVLAPILVLVGLATVGIDITNVGISIVTLLLLVLLQHSQNQDTLGIHAKLDELVTHIDGPRDELAHVEELSQREIKEVRD
jgi:low affinity Fe/Cu permease